MSMRLPDFIIGGAPRSGTTWLYTLLDHHPDIFMAKPISPEPKFFLVDELYEEGISAYKLLFNGAKAQQIAGEKSTNYLESPIAAQRIFNELPNVKLIFILREPAERAYSNYLWSKMNGYETKTFEEALQSEEYRLQHMPSNLRYARPYAYFSRGLYAVMLKPYFDLFLKEQILCLRYEDIINDTDKLTADVHNFLEVLPRPQDADGLGKINATIINTPPIPEDIRKKLMKEYAIHNMNLSELLGRDLLW